MGDARLIGLNFYLSAGVKNAVRRGCLRCFQTDLCCQSDRRALARFRCAGTEKRRARTARENRKLIGLNKCLDFALISAADTKPKSSDALCALL